MLWPGGGMLPPGSLEGECKMIKRSLLVFGLAGLLSACGFQLRGTGDAGQFALRELDLSARNAYGDTVRQVRQSLEASNVRVHDGAPYELVLVRENQRQRTASYTSSARSAEYELTSELVYELRGKQNLPLASNKLQVQKVYVHDQNNITGSSQEAAQLREEMRRELVQQLVMRLQQITPSRLDELQQKAEERARAEAQALEEARRSQQQEPQQSPLLLPIPNR